MDDYLEIILSIILKLSIEIWLISCLYCKGWFSTYTA